MSGFYEAWLSNGVWYAHKWMKASPEYGGPFLTREEALQWCRN